MRTLCRAAGRASGAHPPKPYSPRVGFVICGAVYTIMEGLERQIAKHIDPVAVAKLLGDAIEPVPNLRLRRELSPAALTFLAARPHR